MGNKKRTSLIKLINILVLILGITIFIIIIDSLKRYEPQLSDENSYFSEGISIISTDNYNQSTSYNTSEHTATFSTNDSSVSDDSLTPDESNVSDDTSTTQSEVESKNESSEDVSIPNNSEVSEDESSEDISYEASEPSESSETSEFSEYSEISGPQIINYTVKYNANGGSGTMGQTDFVYDVAESLAACSYTKTGYIFEGWATTPSGSVIYSDKSTVKNLTSRNNDVITFYAIWQPITYTVEYNANGGSGSMNHTSFVYNETKALAPCVYTKTGYEFQGWATTSSGGVSYVDKISVKNLTATNGIVVKFYAVWKPITYTVKFNANGGTGSMTYITCTYNANITLTTNAFIRIGYTFMGWGTSVNGSVIYSDKAVVKNLTSTSGTTINLYAVWQNTENSYIINFNSNSGTGTMTSQAVSLDETKALNTNTFSKTGYTFQGWATSSGGSVVYSNKASVNNLTTAGNAITLYAVWNPITYTVKFNANGGAGTMASITCTYDKAVALPACTFGHEKESSTGSIFVFTGWATSKNGNVQYSNKASIKNLTTENGATINLYAMWEYQQMSITVKVVDKNGNPVPNANVVIGYIIDRNLTTNNQGVATFSFKYYSSVKYAVKVSKSGYVPVEWGYAGQSVGYNDCKFYEDKEGETYTRTYTFTLYPEQAGKNVVYYHANGEIGTTAPTYYTPGQKITFAQCGFTRPGYKFMGWMYNDAHAITQMQANVIYNGYRYAAGETAYVDSAAINKQGVANLYAVWAQIDDKYTIKFDANGGTGTMSDIIVDRSQFSGYIVYSKWSTSNPDTRNSILNPANFSVINIPCATFTRPGYAFDGWEFTLEYWDYSGIRIEREYKLWVSSSLTELNTNTLNLGMHIQFDIFEAGTVNTLKAIWRKVDNTTDNTANNYEYDDVCFAYLKTGRFLWWSPDTTYESAVSYYGDNLLDFANGVRITKYNGTANNVNIPATINGKPVVIIGEDAFYRNDTLYNITIPETVRIIEKEAFYQCYYLKSINLPNGLRVIEEGAFSLTSSLRSIVFPNSLIQIKDRAFEYSSLADISLIINNPNLSIGRLSFKYTKIKTVDIISAACIYSDMFSSCGFDSVYIGANIGEMIDNYDDVDAIDLQPYIKNLYFELSKETIAEKGITWIVNGEKYKSVQWQWDAKAYNIIYSYQK